MLTPFNINNVYIYCSPKCGHTFIHWFIEENKKLLSEIDERINILILRNPIDRIISYYCDFVLNLSVKSELKSNKKNKFEIEVGNTIDIGYENSSFSDLINIIHKTKDVYNLNTCDSHIAAQYCCFYKVKQFNLVVDTTELETKFKDFFTNINNDFVFKFENKHKNKTIRDKDIKINISNYNIEQIKKLGGVPSNNNLFLNRENVMLIYKIYKIDIEMYNTLLPHKKIN